MNKFEMEDFFIELIIHFVWTTFLIWFIGYLVARLLKIKRPIMFSIVIAIIGILVLGYYILNLRFSP
ncbi:hypothetical protein EDL99_06410 [Ornithobacterium rhinotracheale]|nr:hypothetical protein [Ornithobacterium rhinotracheale]